MQISSPTCSAKQTFLYFTDDYIRSTLGDKVSLPNSTRAKLCMRELNRIRLHTPSLTRGAVAPFCSVNLSPPLPVRSFSRFPSPIPIRIAPAPNPNVILHRILQRGGSEFNCKACHSFCIRPASSYIEAKSRTKDVFLVRSLQ